MIVQRKHLFVMSLLVTSVAAGCYRYTPPSGQNANPPISAHPGHMQHKTPSPNSLRTHHEQQQQGQVRIIKSNRWISNQWKIVVENGMCYKKANWSCVSSYFLATSFAKPFTEDRKCTGKSKQIWEKSYSDLRWVLWFVRKIHQSSNFNAHVLFYSIQFNTHSFHHGLATICSRASSCTTAPYNWWWNCRLEFRSIHGTDSS